MSESLSHVENDPRSAQARARPGPGGTEDLYGTQRFPDPDAARLQAWLSAIVGSGHAAELARAVDAAPPPPAAWRPRSDAG